MKRSLLLLALLPLALAAYNPSAVAAFADANWNCGDPSCSYRVSAGQSQSDYQCAEFASRSIAAGGAIPGLSSTASASTYGSFSYKGNSYNLRWTSYRWGVSYGLEDMLKTLGWRNIGTDCSRVTTGMVVFTDSNGGPYSHVTIAVGPKLLNSHNNARYHLGSCAYGTPSGIYQAPDNPTPPPQPPANCKGKYTVNANGVNLRSSASPTGTILTTMFSGDIVYDIVGTTTANGGYNWRKVVSGSTVGFVNDNLLTNAGPCGTSPVSSKYCSSADPVLNVRDKPCTDGNRVAAIPKGNYVEDLGIEGDFCGYTWRKVSYEGTVGYAADQYLTPCTPAGQYVTNVTIDTTSDCFFPDAPPSDQLYRPSTQAGDMSAASVVSAVAFLICLAVFLLA